MIDTTMNNYTLYNSKHSSTLLVTTSIAVLGVFLPAKAQQVKTQPNIILFMVDDMGWQDTSFPLPIRLLPIIENTIHLIWKDLLPRG